MTAFAWIMPAVRPPPPVVTSAAPPRIRPSVTLLPGPAVRTVSAASVMESTLTAAAGAPPPEDAAAAAAAARPRRARPQSAQATTRRQREIMRLRAEAAEEREGKERESNGSAQATGSDGAAWVAPRRALRSAPPPPPRALGLGGAMALSERVGDVAIHVAETGGEGERDDGASYFDRLWRRGISKHSE
ncbi:MAG: hypothetical protein VX017_09915, partial [Pseudomonadota bacterium]|nr:hypothetical protein [Pseudomonadota bacterium]